MKRTDFGSSRPHNITSVNSKPFLLQLLLICLALTACLAEEEEKPNKKRHIPNSDQAAWKPIAPAQDFHHNFDQHYHHLETNPSPFDLGTQIHKQITVTKTIGIPYPKPYPVHVERKIPIPIPIPVKVPVDKPYPVHVPRPYPVTVEKPIPFTIKKTIPYPVKVPVKVPYPVKVPIPVPKPYPVYIEKTVPVHVPKPIPVQEEAPVWKNDEYQHESYEHYDANQFTTGSYLDETH